MNIKCSWVILSREESGKVGRRLRNKNGCTHGIFSRNEDLVHADAYMFQFSIPNESTTRLYTKCLAIESKLDAYARLFIVRTP